MVKYYEKVNLGGLDKIENLFLRELKSRCILGNKLYLDDMKKEFDLKTSGNVHYERDRKKRIGQLRKIGVQVRNYGRSFYINNISYGCLSCPHWYKNGYLIDVTQACNRKCFFCYNGMFLKLPFSKPKIKNILYDRYKDGKRLVLSIGNSEPLLAPDRVFESLKLVRKLTKGKCYTFLYTNGDFLTADVLKRLKENMLDEIRISIKPQESNLKPLILAKDYIPHVMVEMPIFPNDENNMKRLLLELNKLNIFGINLSHLLCTRANKENLKARGYKIITDKFKPFYESLLPHELSVYGSEETCFNLLEFAVNKKLKIGVHYCSNENFRANYLNRRLLHAKKVKRPYETITKYGLLKKIVIYWPDYFQAHKDLQRHGVSEQQIGISQDKKRLETHVNNLHFLNTDKYEIGILYSLPEGQEVKIKILNFVKKLERKSSLPQVEEKRLQNQVAMHIARLMILERDYTKAEFFFRKALLSYSGESQEKYFYLLEYHRAIHKENSNIVSALNTVN